ncbi:MAG: iron chelate uptake ABC transporter family permease subunit [Tissierellaceae bacterium]|nr:iron chelate uptake ABC transporter family permease subunit [Tissierellaceae bacterium]
MLKRKISILIIISVVLIFLFVFLGVNSNNWRYFFSRRVPKVIAIILTGASIAISSLIFQTVTNNRILTPSALGLDSLYVFIQSAVVFLIGSSNPLVANKNMNFALTVIVMIVFSGLLYKVLFTKEKSNIMILLLIGMIFGTLFQSLSSFMQMMIDPNEFLHIQDKMFASFNNVNTNILWISSILITLIGIYSFKFTRILDVLSLGREQAINLGVDYDWTIKRLLLIVSILVSISTALVGPITFLGLLVVNLAREFTSRFEHKFLIVTSILLSVIALVGGQLVVERIFNFGTPISVIINFIGGIYFVNLLLKENVA